MTSPLPITVIVPIFNVARYLPACVQSLANQSRPVRIVLVDDGSTDGSARIADLAAARRPNFDVIHQPNRGLSAARNAGLEHAGARTILRRYARRLISPMVWDGLYKRSLFTGVGFPEGRLHEDEHTMPLLLERAKRLVLIPDVLYLYRARPTGITGSLSLGRLESFHALRELKLLLLKMAISGRALKSVLESQALRAAALLCEAAVRGDSRLWRSWQKNVKAALGPQCYRMLSLLPTRRLDAWFLLLASRLGFLPFQSVSTIHRRLRLMVHRYRAARRTGGGT